MKKEKLFSFLIVFTILILLVIIILMNDNSFKDMTGKYIKVDKNMDLKAIRDYKVILINNNTDEFYDILPKKISRKDFKTSRFIKNKDYYSVTDYIAEVKKKDKSGFIQSIDEKKNNIILEDNDIKITEKYSDYGKKKEREFNIIEKKTNKTLFTETIVDSEIILRTDLDERLVRSRLTKSGYKLSKSFVGLYLVRDSKKSIEEIMNDPSFNIFIDSGGFIEPNYVFGLEEVPDDPSYGSQWGLEKIDAPEAWNITTGSKDVIVAILDTGVDYDHPDLYENIWINENEIPGNMIDDDMNGYIDDIYGWDFQENHNDPNDMHSHGSHCAGIIGAVGNNSIGVTGVNWNVKIMSLKVATDSGGFNSYAVASGLNYAINNGALISSNSYNSPPSSTLKYALEKSLEANHIFVAAAGNYATDGCIYPASTPQSNIVAVAASTSSDTKASFSNYNNESVDLAAPGVGIYSTSKNGGYTSKSGTSMATPYVAGLLALIKSIRPDLNHTELIDILFQGTDYLPAFEGKSVTEGRINANNSIMLAIPNTPKIHVSTIDRTLYQPDYVMMPNTYFGQPIDLKIFVENLCLNDSADPLILGDINVPIGYSVIKNFSINSLDNKENTSMTIRLDANIIGKNNGYITFPTNDPDIGTFKISVKAMVYDNTLTIIDNEDSGYSSYRSYYMTETGYRGTYEFINTYGNATFTFDIIPGNYNVSATIPNDSEWKNDLSNDSLFEIFDDNIKVGEKNINPKEPDYDFNFDYVDWINLGEYNFNSNILKVFISSTQGYTLSDAAIIQRLGPTNSAPVLDDIGDKTINEGDSLNIFVNATDSDDNDTLFYSASNLPNGSSFTDQTFSWTTDDDDSGTYSIMFEVTDGSLIDSENVSITVNNVLGGCIDNDLDKFNQSDIGCGLPDCNDTDSNINPGESELCDSLDNDCNLSSLDGSDEVWFGSSTNCGIGECYSDGLLTCIDGSQVNTCAPLIPQDEVCDGLDNDCNNIIDNGDLCISGYECINGSCINTNNLPVLDLIGTKNITEGDFLVFVVTATDLDLDDILTYSADDLPSGANLDSSTGLFQWQTGIGDTGVYFMTINVSDSKDHDSELVMIIVNPLVYNQSECILTSAYFSENLTLVDNQINLIVKGINCNDDNISFRLNGTQNKILPQLGSFVDNIASISWISEFGVYNFISELIMNSSMKINSLDFLNGTVSVISDSCKDIDDDGYGICPDCGLSKGCLYDEEDCDDLNPIINPKMFEGWRDDNDEWGLCDDNKDNDCNGLIDCDEESCKFSQKCKGCTDYNSTILPSCMVSVCNDGDNKFIFNDSACDDGNNCTLDFCSVTGCNNVYNIQDPNCLLEVVNCQDVDDDGIYEYDIVNCQSGRDSCLGSIDDIINHTDLIPVVVDFEIVYNDSSLKINNMTQFKVIKENIIEVEFTEPIDFAILNNSGCYDKFLLDSIIKINDKKISIDSMKFTGLNKKAKIKFYNVRFISPKILKDGTNCNDCSLIEYNKESNYVYIKVNGFSEYEVVEGYTGDTGGSSTTYAGGSGGGSITSIKSDKTECTENWACSKWEECDDTKQKRFCKDLNNCTTTTNKPVTEVSCELNIPLMDESILPKNIPDEIKSPSKINGTFYLNIFSIFLVIIIITVISILIRNKYLSKKI